MTYFYQSFGLVPAWAFASGWMLGMCSPAAYRWVPSALGLGHVAPARVSAAPVPETIAPHHPVSARTVSRPSRPRRASRVEETPAEVC
ncbi:hypothetical protein MARPU_06465 [Marichromatium purpuratum 984]|uniref:Uncharacterized protein n=1 Tax=Marichromatium purpuratum 984 TaxID=765910 RepID=W0E3V8_MARPU|nr:hypothetical protein [Marichromatium purpuratum]AHF05442.1 hypothetical protein MARPU_06465 [Marichromatium purpuratum 984]